MTLKNKSIVVLLSGGLDSSTVTGIAKKSEAKIFGLSFDYGQRHKKELNSASIIAKHFDIEGYFFSSHEFLVSHHEHPTLQPANLTKKALFPA